jgi:glutamate synthase domain-containing protein 3
VEQHFAETNSVRAKYVLENWAELSPKFLKVFPHDYKRVLGIPRSEAMEPKIYAPVIAVASGGVVASAH